MVRQQEKTNKDLNKTPKTSNSAPIPYSGDPIVETQDEVRLAYQTYVEAQKDLKYAVKEQEQQGENAHKNNERRYRAYEEMVEKAFKKRENADNEALELYRKAVEQAAADYRKTLDRNLQECKQTTDQAWQSSLITRKTNTQAPVSNSATSFNSIKRYLGRTASNTKSKLAGTFNRIARPHSTN